MPRNRRKNSDSIRIATCFWWLLAFAFVTGMGVSYVSIKNQALAFGEERRKLEIKLKQVTEGNRAMNNQITGLTSRTALKRQVDAGFIDLIEIDPTQVIRLTPGQPVPGLVEETSVPARVLAQK